MIVISKHSNQLCNRLFTYLPALSYALEANESVCFLFQYKGYNSLFPNLEKEGIHSYWIDSQIRPSIQSKIFNAVIRCINKFTHLVIRPNEKVPLHQPLRYLFNSKWKEARQDQAYINKHAPHLRFLFSPSESVWEQINHLLHNTDADMLTIGVHIRRGDYRTYRNGIYFYELDVYHQYMLHLKKIFEEQNKQVRFLICSNEPIDLHFFSQCNTLMQKGKDMLVDLYALSKCDYIIGPPSTYSQWASFYGEVPLQVLNSAHSTLSLDKFSITKSLDNYLSLLSDENAKEK